MKVLVTGGTGNVGRTAVAYLLQQGYQVRVIGRRPNVTIEGAEYLQCDVNDFDRLLECTKGMEAIVHLAAIANPAFGPGQEIFRVNCAGTFNVFEAAARQGIKRVVTASSINALGFYFGVKSFPIEYFPIDEEHPTFTTDPYSFSKQIVEEIAAYYWRREGISSICLRLPAVYEAEEGNWIVEAIAYAAQAVRELCALPEEERQKRAQEISKACERWRKERISEQPWDKVRAYYETPEALLIFARSNFWASIDARDAAQAIEKGLSASYEGSHPLYINDSHNFTGLESEFLLRTFFPQVRGRKHPLCGDEALVSITKARALIGFEPAYPFVQLQGQS